MNVIGSTVNSSYAVGEFILEKHALKCMHISIHNSLMLSPEEFFSLQFIMKTKNVFTEITFSGDRRVFSINLVISPYF
jgi:hypothetical protein